MTFGDHCILSLGFAILFKGIKLSRYLRFLDDNLEWSFADWDQTQRLLSKRGIDLGTDQLQQILDPINTLQNNRSVGGTSPKEVKRMSQNFSTQLDQIEVQISSRLNHIDRARKKTRQIIDLVLSGQQLTTIEID